MNQWIGNLLVNDKVLVEDKRGEIPVVEFALVKKTEWCDNETIVTVETKNGESARFLSNEPSWSMHILPLPKELSSLVNWYNVS